MALDSRWDDVEAILKRMANDHHRYRSSASSLRSVIKRMRESEEFVDVHAVMTLHDLILTRKRTGLFIALNWTDEHGFQVGIGRPSPEEYWGWKFTRDADEIVDIVKEYLKET